MKPIVLTILGISSVFCGCTDSAVAPARPLELTRLHGKTEAEVIAELGAPSSSDVMTLKQETELPELYIEIHNTYPPSDPKTQGVEIKELRWHRDGSTEAVFMHKVDGDWTVLESCRWQDGIVF